MNQGKYIFSQICDFLPKNQFDWFVKKYQGNKYVNVSSTKYKYLKIW